MIVPIGYTWYVTCPEPETVFGFRTVSANLHTCTASNADLSATIFWTSLNSLSFHPSLFTFFLLSLFLSFSLYFLPPVFLFSSPPCISSFTFHSSYFLPPLHSIFFHPPFHPFYSLFFSSLAILFSSFHIVIFNHLLVSLILTFFYFLLVILFFYPVFILHLFLNTKFRYVYMN